jgi:Lrp/AsnC family transcriptional regulator, leucine-responsive regulatory protein
VGAMVRELDEKDRAILFYLDEDSRIPVSKLAKKVQLSRELVRYRMERMVQEKVIQKYLTFITLPKTGYNVTTVFFRFQDTSVKDEEEVIKYLLVKKNVIWLASMDGRFNLGFTLCVYSTKEVAEFIDTLKDKYGKFMSDFQIASIVSAWRFPRKYLLKDSFGEREFLSEHHPESISIDSVDKAVLIALGEDGRMTAVEIAKKVGVSPDTVADRIRSLKKRGIIAGIGVITDNLVLGRRLFRTFLTFHNLISVEKKFMNYCKEHPNSVQLKRMLGPWEYEVDLEVADETELRRINSAFKETFQESVRATSFVSIYKIHKYNLTDFLK